MIFVFNDGSSLREALAHALRYNFEKHMFELDVLGLDNDGFSFTVPGKAYIDEEEVEEMKRNEEIEFPHDLVGMRFLLDCEE